MEYYSAMKRNAFESDLVRQLKLQAIIQSEVSQKEKNKFHILTYIYGTQKNGMDGPIFRAGIEMQTQRIETRHRGVGQGGTSQESSLDMYTRPCVKTASQWGAVCNTGSPAWCSAMTQRGRMGETGAFTTEETCVSLGLIHTV